MHHITYEKNHKVLTLALEPSKINNLWPTKVRYLHRLDKEYGEITILHQTTYVKQASKRNRLMISFYEIATDTAVSNEICTRVCQLV